MRFWGKYFSILIYFLFATALLSCRNKAATYVEDISKGNSVWYIDISKMRKTLNPANVLTDIQFIPLETTKSSMLAAIDKVVYSGEKYYIFDKRFQSLKVFDHNGMYIRSIGKTGDGPGEYAELDDFIIDAKTKNIILLDDAGESLHYFDSHGNYIKDMRINMRPCYFGMIENHIFCHINNYFTPLSKNFNLIGMDSLGKIITRLFPLSQKLNYRMNYSGFLTGNPEGLLFNSAFNDTVFQLTTNKAYPKYIFSFGSDKIPVKAQNPFQTFSTESLSYSYLASHVAESKNIFFFSLFKKTDVIFAFCRKREDGPAVVIPQSIGFPIGEALGVTDDDRFISSIPVPQLLIILNNNTGKLSKDSIKDDYPGLYKLLPELNESANPILTVFKFKSDL